MPWPQRIQAAQEILTAFAPDWVSLQFVPYAFHSKGLVWGLGPRLRPLLAGRRVQVMFHELWLGSALRASKKHRFVGTAQKHYIKQFLRQIAPQVVHTSNGTYKGILKQGGIHAVKLPMFGSIPVTQDKGDDWLFAELMKAGLPITVASRSRFWLIGFFGALHPGWPPEPLFARLQTEALRQERQVALISVGGLSGGEELWSSLSKTYGSQFTFLRLGSQSVDKVSQYFNSLDFAIATSPYPLIGKSSSAAAMREHGLHVIVNRDDVQFALSEDDAPSADIWKLDKNFETNLRGPCQCRTICAGLPSTAHQFLRDLEKADTRKKEAFLHV